MIKYDKYKKLKQKTNTEEIVYNIMLDKLLINLQNKGGINGKSVERI